MFGFAARAGMQALRASASNRNTQMIAYRAMSAAAAEGGVSPRSIVHRHLQRASGCFADVLPALLCCLLDVARTY
jgi:hypothetical protein